MKSNKRKTILIDLDGVLNTYDGEFDENCIPPVKEGAKNFLEELSHEYKLKVFTTRDKELVGEWVEEHKLKPFINDITNTKEPCYLYIDDRCICFQGDYKQLKTDIKNFKVWWQ